MVSEKCNKSIISRNKLKSQVPPKPNIYGKEKKSRNIKIMGKKSINRANIQANRIQGWESKNREFILQDSKVINKFQRFKTRRFLKQQEKKKTNSI